MKKLAHTLVLAVFAIGCFCSWGVLTLASHVRHEILLPPFTTLCIGLRPLLFVLPILAAAYCLWVWFRKADRVPPWFGFFATTIGVLVLVTLPAMVAAYLPLLAAMNHLASK